MAVDLAAAFLVKMYEAERQAERDKMLFEASTKQLASMLGIN